MAAQQSGPEAAEALEKLCHAYWYPLYAFIRRRGHDPLDAQDLTQAFFCHLLQRQVLTAADRSKGRFRSFLIGALKNFLANEWDREQTQKRGGGAAIFSLDGQTPEERYRMEPVDDLTPEAIYERRWAETVVEQVVARMRRESSASDRADRFDHLKEFLLRDPATVTYAEVAEQLGISVSAVTSAIHRMRIRFRELFHAEIAQTVATASEIEDEIRYLVHALSN